MTKFKCLSFSLAIASYLLASCAEKDRSKELEGTWKTDSVYLYDNGFGFTKRELEEEPLHHYHKEGKLKMTRGNESRWFRYVQIPPDSLTFRDEQEKVIARFIILQLNTEHLVLKKQKNPIFPGPEQNRFEIRYFSKVTMKEE